MAGERIPATKNCMQKTDVANPTPNCIVNSLLDLLLGPQLITVPTLLLPTINCTRVKTGITLAANHLLLVVLPCQSHQGGLNDSSSQAQYQMQG
jgi:hypothetical protein